GDAEVRVLLDHRAAQGRRMGRTGFAIDVEAVPLATDAGDARAERSEYLGRHLVGRAVRAIQHDVLAREVGRRRQRAEAETRVTLDGVVDAARLAQPLRRGGGERRVDLAFDLRLHRIVQFLADGGEELDAVVLIRIVRGADHDAGAGAEFA